MALSRDAIRFLLEGAGFKPSSDQIERTEQLYSSLDSQLSTLPADSLESIEPHYILPIADEKKRR